MREGLVGGSWAIARGPDPLAGFTLPELVIVLLLVGILGVYIAPRLELGPLSEQGYTEELLAGIRYAHQLALASGCGVTVNLGASGFDLAYSGAPGACAAAPVRDPARGVTFAESAPAGLTLSGLSFSYDGLGRASQGQTITVGGQTIQVVAETGFAYRP